MRTRSRARCLIADNDELVLINLEHALEASGFDVTTAWSGSEAMELLSATPYEVLVLDDFLSDMSGLEVLQGLQRLPRPPLVLVTTCAPPSFAMMDRFLRAGAAAVAPKPDVEAIVNYVWAMSASFGRSVSSDQGLAPSPPQRAAGAASGR